jgi:hypothetical protein
MRILSFFLAASICSADIADHRYKQGEHVELWVNKVNEPRSRGRIEERWRCCVEPIPGLRHSHWDWVDLSTVF